MCPTKSTAHYAISPSKGRFPPSARTFQPLSTCSMGAKADCSFLRGKTSCSACRFFRTMGSHLERACEVLLNATSLWILNRQGTQKERATKLGIKLKGLAGNKEAMFLAQERIRMLKIISCLLLRTVLSPRLVLIFSMVRQSQLTPPIFQAFPLLFLSCFFVSSISCP